jgi:hypothetical protein
LLAKREKTIIRPSPLLQAVDFPKPILKGKPTVFLNFGGAQAFHTILFIYEWMRLKN